MKKQLIKKTLILKQNVKICNKTFFQELNFENVRQTKKIYSAYNQQYMYKTCAIA